ncbi:hypothetical protein AB0M39_35085 [Streptomyces sp. NPDC051907]|uniref:hypothetical protein n=1 Tax=Streptomyces sp. NPDC051907 TaxID=3155284 RepID=UPI003449DD26
MDDEITPASDPAELRRIALQCEAGLRGLHKQLRGTGCQEASFAALEGADKALAAARALAAEPTPVTPRLRAVPSELLAAG